MKHLLRPFSFFFTSLLLAGIVLAQPVWAQGPPPSAWATFKPTNPFNTPIHIIEFDTLGPLGANRDPLNGYVGDDTEIWYSTSGGGATAVWHKATVNGSTPTPFITGWVNDITWKNAAVGFAITQGDTTRGGSDHGVLITTDTGKTWTFDTHAGTPDSGCGISYNVARGWLFVASLDKGLVVSTDDGTTWTVIDPRTYYTGFAFTDWDHGVLATQGSSTTFGVPPINYWLYTTDGGKTWNTSRMSTESWQPLGIRPTKTFFASTMQHYLGNVSTILRSDDGGYAFAPIPSWNNSGDSLTECMEGDGCTIFASSFSSGTGMYYSITDGQNFNPMPPTNPNPPVDSRFYVSPDTVWSFTGSRLFWCARTTFNTADIHIWPDSVAFTSAACDTALDTIIHIFGCNCNNNDSIRSVTVTQSSDSIFTVPGILPRPLCTGVAVEGGPDSIHLKYQPTSTANDVGRIKITLGENGTAVDTFIGVYGNGVSPNIHPVTPGRIVMSAPACGSDDTCFEIINTSCSCVQISSCAIDEDPCAAQLISFPDCATKLPITLNAGERFQFCVHFQAALQKSTGPNTPEANLAFNWVSCDGLTHGVTSPIQVYGITTSTERPLFRGINIVGNCCTIPTDTTIYFVDTSCDTLILNTPTLFGNAPPNMFTLEMGGKIPLHFPDTLPPHIPLPIHVHINCQKGTYLQHIAFSYTIGTSGVECATLSAADTATLSIVSSGDITGPTVGPINTRFGTVSCCDSTQVKTITITNGCEPDTITGLVFDSSNGNFYIVSGLQLPLALSPMQQVTLQVGFRPRCGGGSGGTDTGSVWFSFASGTKGVFSALNATSSNLAAVSPGVVTINFDTLQCDQNKCDSVTITNASCGAIKINSIQNPANAAFTLMSPAAGTSIPVGGTATVVVCLNPGPTKAWGDLTDLAVLTVTDLTGLNGSWDTINLVAHVDSPVVAHTTTQLATQTMCDTTTLTEQFTLTNTGTCYTYVVTGASSTSGAKVTATPHGANYPVSVAPGGSQVFDVLINPGGQGGTLAGNIILQNADGTTDTIPYDIIVDTCNQQPSVLTLSDTNSDFVTTNCTDLARIFKIAASTGTITVTNVTLSGGNRFRQSLNHQLPFTVSSADTLYDTIIYFPDAAGVNNATLSIGNLPTLNLTGSVTGAHFNAKIGITSTAPALDSPGVNMNFTINLENAIPDTIGMDSLTLVVGETSGLLTLVNTTGSAAWQLQPPSPGSSAPWTIKVKYIGTATNGMIPVGPLATFTAYPAIGKTDTSSVSVTGPDIFNDTQFARCKMSAQSDGSSIPFRVGLTCGDSIIMKQLQGNLQSVVPSIEVVPNPAHKDGSAATLQFTTAISGVASIEVVDVLGNTVSELMNGQLEKGDHAVSIPTNQMAEGAYFVRISMNGYTVVRKFVLEKE